MEVGADLHLGCGRIREPLDQKLCGALGADDGDPCGGPGEVQIGGQLLGAHHRVRPAVGLADRQVTFGTMASTTA